MSELFKLGVYASVAFLFVMFLVLMGHLLGPRSTKSSMAKYEPYECGIKPKGDPRKFAPIGYISIAILFLIFEAEIVFLIPWALNVKGLGEVALLELILFFVILFSGFIYLWKNGDLDWTRK